MSAFLRELTSPCLSQVDMEGVQEEKGKDELLEEYEESVLQMKLWENLHLLFGLPFFKHTYESCVERCEGLKARLDSVG